MNSNKLIFVLLIFMGVSRSLQGPSVPSSDQSDQHNWITLSTILLDNDPVIAPKISYIRRHKLDLYKYLIDELSAKTTNGLLYKPNVVAWIHTLYQTVAYIALAKITSGEETFGGRLSYIKSKNEVAYQKLLTNITNKAGSDGLVLRDYCQNEVNTTYWKVRFSVWYATAALYVGSAVTSTYNFLTNSVVPPLKSVYTKASSWLAVKKSEVSKWWSSKPEVTIVPKSE